MVPRATAHPVYLRNGSVIENTTDLSVSGPAFSWQQARTYQSGITGTTRLGGKWLSSNGDRHLTLDTTPDPDTVTLLADATAKWVFTDNGSGYTSPTDSSLVLEEDTHTTAGDVFKLTDTISGDVWIFYDFVGDHQGQLYEHTTRAWQDAGETGTVYSYSNGQISQITSPEGQEYNIVFAFNASYTRLESVEVRTGTTGSTAIERVEYTYFGTGHSSDIGSDDDLVQVKVSRLKLGGTTTNDADWISRYTQYRYDSDAGGQLKAVFEPAAIQRMIDDRSDITDAEDILDLGDDDDNNTDSPEIHKYSSRWFTYHKVDMKTDNSGAGTTQDPKCVTVFNASGEDLETKYGGADVDEADTTNDVYMVKSEVIGGGCSSCGDAGIERRYYYMDTSVDHGTPDVNEIVRLVVEDTVGIDGTGVSRKIYGLNDGGRRLREAVITDPDGTESFWCKSWKLKTGTHTDKQLLKEYRTPAAHNVTDTTIDEFLDPSHNGSFTNDSSTLEDNAGRITVYEYGDTGGSEFPTATLVKEGETGTASYVSATDYYGGTNVNRKHLVTARYSFPEAGKTSRTDTSRVRDWYWSNSGDAGAFWSGTDEIKKVVVTLPPVVSGENGSGTAYTLEEYYDEVGRLRWEKDADGAVTYHSYHPTNGQLAYTVRDADPTGLPTSADSNSTYWVSSTDQSEATHKPSRGGSLPTAVKLVTQRYFDNKGRETTRVNTHGNTSTNVYHFTCYEPTRTLRVPYFDGGTATYMLPVQVTEFDAGGTVTETYAVDPAQAEMNTNTNLPQLKSGTDQDDYVSWTKYVHDDVSGHLTAVRRYYDIPAPVSGEGDEDNYAETAYGYDAMGRRARVVSPGDTITRYVFDELGRQTETWIGTNDTPTSGDWSPTNNTGDANMVQVAEVEYDGGNDGGNSNRTKITRRVDGTSTNDIVTERKYDWRDRLVFSIDAEDYSNGTTTGVLYTRRELDNLGRAKMIERYWDSGGNNTSNSYVSSGAAVSGDRLISRTATSYDTLGRVYQTKTYEVDASDGSVSGDYLLNDVFYNGRGTPIKRKSGGSERFTKTAYDGLGRTTGTYIGYDTSDSGHGDADDVTGDTIFKQTITTYDGDETAAVVHYARKHTDGTTTGALSNSTARQHCRAFWYDSADRMTTLADYGTNGGSSFTRPGTAPTSSSSTVLVTKTAYDEAGRSDETTDPAGRVTTRVFDDMNRVTKTIQNDVTTPTTSDQDVTVEMAYNADGLLETLTAHNTNDGSQANQVTTYVYGTDLSDSSAVVHRNDLLAAVIYPDSDDTSDGSLGNGTDSTYDRVEYKYDRQGRRIWMKDQAGTTHEYTLDDNGRLTEDDVTAFGTGIDQTIHTIQRTYEIRGQVEKVSSLLSNGNTRNEIVYEYNDLGMLAKEYQEHEGAKDANTLYVQYDYDDTASSNVLTKGMRPEMITYPNGRKLHVGYASGDDDNLGRASFLADDNSGSAATPHLADYEYLGLGRTVQIDHGEPDLRFDLDHGTAGAYDGLDRFGRVVDLQWIDYGPDPDVEAVWLKYGYDEMGNREYREDSVAAAASAPLDELYDYDAVNRLTLLKRGDLNGTYDDVTNKIAREAWTHDATGNWETYKQDTDTDSTWELEQARDHNKANEIDTDETHGETGVDADNPITKTAGDDWIDPIQDAAGNMVRLPSPLDVETGLDCTYDAWNRLITTDDGTTEIWYLYDGLNRRSFLYDGTDVRYYYHSNRWQVIEERTGVTNPTVDRQKVWGLGYVDELILRDRDATTGGDLGKSSSGLDERLYALQDANWNTVAIADTAGDVQQRYIYDAYGKVTRLNPTTFLSYSGADYDWKTLYTGRCLDTETGLYYYRNRYYSAELGRFVSRDPILYEGSPWNLYQYVDSRPTIATDPTGKVVPVIVGGGVAFCVYFFWPDTANAPAPGDTTRPSNPHEGLPVAAVCGLTAGGACHLMRCLGPAASGGAGGSGTAGCTLSALARDTLLRYGNRPAAMAALSQLQAIRDALPVGSPAFIRLTSRIDQLEAAINEVWPIIGR